MNNDPLQAAIDRLDALNHSNLHSKGISRAIRSLVQHRRAYRKVTGSLDMLLDVLKAELLDHFTADQLDRILSIGSACAAATDEVCTTLGVPNKIPTVVSIISILDASEDHADSILSGTIASLPTRLQLAIAILATR